MTTHHLAFLSTALALFLAFTTHAGAAVPRIEVTVSDASGRVAFRGATDANATFSTADLPPGRYIVQFHTSSGAAKGNHYLAVVSAGAKKVVAAGVPGETFMHGGVAMKVNAERGTRISGQLADEQTMAADHSTRRVIGGQRFVWVKGALGSNLGGRWVEEGAASAFNSNRYSLESIGKLQDRAGEGSSVSSKAENLGH